MRGIWDFVLHSLLMENTVVPVGNVLGRNHRYLLRLQFLQLKALKMFDLYLVQEEIIANQILQHVSYTIQVAMVSLGSL